MFVQIFHRLVDAIHGRRGVRALAHEHDAFHHVVVVFHDSVRAVNRPPDLPQPDLWPLRHRGNVPNADGRAFLRPEEGLPDVRGSRHQSHGPHIDLLRSRLNETSAAVGV